MKTKVNGILFFKTKSGRYYYINFNKEHIWVEDIKLISTDWIYKDLIIRTAKQYTYRGSQIVATKLHNKRNDIESTIWFELNEFSKKDFIFFD